MYNNMQAEYFQLQFDGEEQCVPIVITLYVATTEHAAHIHSAQHCCSYSVSNLGLTQYHFRDCHVHDKYRWESKPANRTSVACFTEN